MNSVSSFSSFDCRYKVTTNNLNCGDFVQKILSCGKTYITYNIVNKFQIFLGFKALESI